MNAQLPMFGPMTSPDTASATSSPALGSGPMPSVSPDGPTTVQFIPAVVPASPSARPAKAKRSTTKGIFGQSSFGSSKHEDLSFALASKLRPLTDSLGSTLFNLTWITRVTPAGRSISALRASEPLTEGSVYIGWPTPQKHDERERGNTMADHHYFPHDLSNAATMAAWPTPQSSDMTGGGQAKRSDGWANLNDFAMLSGWPTARAEDSESSGMRHSRGVADTMTAVAALSGWGTPAARDWKSGEASQETLDKNARPLSEQAVLAGWKTPCVPNGGRISGNLTDIGKHQDGTKAQVGLENEAKLSGWPTPMAGTPAQNGNNEAGNTDSSRRTVEMCRWPADPSTDFGPGPIGYLLGPNGWEIVPASGQLNAAHSRWLMGLPSAWDDLGATAMASLRRLRKRSSKP